MKLRVSYFVRTFFLAGLVATGAEVPAAAEHWAWEQTPFWTSSEGASVSVHLLNVETAYNPASDQEEVLSFQVGVAGSGVDDDRIQYSLLTPEGEPEYASFTEDSRSASVTNFTQLYPETLGVPDKGQSITNTRTSTGDYYVEFTHTFEPGVAAENGTVLARHFFTHWSDSDISLDSASFGSLSPGIIQRSGTRAAPAVGTYGVNDFNPDANHLFLRPGVIFALLSTDHWLTHFDSAPGSVVRIGPDGNATIGDFDDIYINVNGNIEVGPNAFLNLSSYFQAQLYGNVSTEGGGINASEGGARIGSPDNARATRDDNYRFVADVLGALTDDALDILAQQARDNTSSSDPFYDPNGPRRLELISRVINRVKGGMSQTDARSTFTGDFSLFTNLKVGGDDLIEQVDFVGNVEMDAFSRIEFQVQGDNPATEHDVLVIDGELTLDHFITLGLDFGEFSDAYLPEIGDTWDLITANSINTVVLLVDAPQWEDRTIIAGVVDLADGGQGVRAVTVAIPEPNSAALLAGFLGLLGKSRTRLRYRTCTKSSDLADRSE